MPLSRRRLGAAAPFVALGLLGRAARAEYPERPVRIVVPNPPGGSTDLLARLIGNEITRVAGQPVVIENRPGAGGVLASQYVARSAPDGYTIMMANINSHTINAAVMKNLPYDPAGDFAPITVVGSSPNVLVVNPALSVRNVAELIALAKARPGYLSFGSTSPGGSPHMSGELLKSMAQIDIVHVPYRGAAPMLTDLMGSMIPMAFDNLPSSLGFIRAGSIRALAVTTGQRWPGAPEIPTIAESGLPGYEVSAWFGLVAPAGTPRSVVDRLYAMVGGILKEDRVVQKLNELGAAPGGNTPDAFAAQIRDGIAKWTRVADEAGIKVDQ
jgi:tripartite-type tricarboxylate transporter receptor subunit TctC